MRDSKDTRPQQGRVPQENGQDRLARNLKCAFPVQGLGSFAGLLHAIDDAERQQRA